MSNKKKKHFIASDSSGIDCISIDSDDNQMDCISIDSDTSIEDQRERQFFTSNIEHKFSGEDLCERAAISRRNGDIGLEDYNEDYRYIQKTMEMSRLKDRDIQSVLASVLESIDEQKEFETDSNDSLDNESVVSVNSCDLKDWTPNVVQPPNESEDSFLPLYSFDPIEFRLDSCLRYRSDSALKIPLPFETINKAFGFNDSFVRRLKELNCNPSSLQLHLWPCILKGFSISCISGPKSGKSNAYLIPLMCWFDCEETDTNDVRVGSIVICSSNRKVNQITRQAKRWKALNGSSKVRIVSMNSTNEKRQLTAILNGCDILVTTPSPLLRHIESQMIDSKDTRCLILDDADISLALHKKAIFEIYLAFAKSKKEDNKSTDCSDPTTSRSMAFQTMLFAEKWTREVMWFYKEVQHIPILIFASFYEASIAFNIDCKVVAINEETERDNCLADLLKSIGHRDHIAIVCKSFGEIRFVKKALKLKANESIVVTEETNFFDLEHFSNDWKKGNKYLFITDAAIQTMSGFDSIKCIIHYKLPTDFNHYFGDRFRLMRYHFKKCKTPLIQEYTKDLVNYVLVSPKDEEYITEIVSYLKRLNIEIPQFISEMNQIKSRKLCRNFCAFGKCPIVSVHCFDRHVFNACDKLVPQLPKDGQIKIVVSYVINTNEFYIRINEFRGEKQSSGKWQKMSITFDEIKPKLNEFLNNDYNTLSNINKDEVYGISVRGEVFRVRLSRILGDEELYYYQEYDPNDKSQKVELFCIDYGHKIYSRSRQMFELPEHLKSLPAFAFKTYLFGIKPIDNEIEWDFKSTQKFYELIDNFRITHITAWIVKQVNNVFWINRLNVKKRLKNVKLSIDVNPIVDLVKEHLVVEHNVNLPKSNGNYNKIVNIWQSNRLKDSSYNCHLTDDMTYVVVTEFKSIDEIYVMYENRVKRLESLEQEWNSQIHSMEVMSELTEGQLCFCQFDHCLNRSKILSINNNSVNVLFVDRGETAYNIPKSSVYRIKDHHLKELPFQAIKVKLFGITPLKTITYDLICDLTRDKEEHYLLVIAEKLNYENGIYTVRLLVAQDQNETQFVALSQLLVDRNYAQYIDGEQNNKLSLTINKTAYDNDEEEDDYMDHISNEMVDNFCKDFILQSLGLKEEENIDAIQRKSSEKPVSAVVEMSDMEVAEEKINDKQVAKESRMSKIMRNIQLLKARRLAAQNAVAITSDDEEEEPQQRRLVEPIDYKPGDFDYEVGEGVLFYDPNDDFDKDSLHSDEDAMFEEIEELT